jgi:hypothetical protein
MTANSNFDCSYSVRTQNLRNYLFLISQKGRNLLVEIHQSEIVFKMEDTVANAIYQKDVSTLTTLLEEGFDLNKQYKYPIGCVRLFHVLFLKGCKIISCFILESM